MNRYLDRLHQAENDLQWAVHSFSGGFFAQTCFVSQQAGEKSLKALCYKRGFDIIKTHSLVQIIKALGVNGEMEQIAKELDLYYISGRYPDAFPAGAPFEMLSADQADRAVKFAQRLLFLVRGHINEPESS